MFNYDPASNKFRADLKSLSDCGYACHTPVKAKDYIFHPYQKRAVSKGTIDNSIRIDQKSYEMPPREGISIAHFLTVADINRSAHYYEKVFGAILVTPSGIIGCEADQRLGNERRA